MKLAESVTKFLPFDDRESETAFFHTRVPWVRSDAYLNIIFKPPVIADLRRTAAALALPQSFCNWLQFQNGAILFSGALSIYGVHAPGQLLNRSDPFLALPFNIETENADDLPPDPDRLVAIGGYGADSSRVCLDRKNLHIELWPRDGLGLHPRITWASLDRWLIAEVSRLGMLFREDGKLLVPESETLPGRAGRPN